MESKAADRPIEDLKILAQFSNALSILKDLGDGASLKKQLNTLLDAKKATEENVLEATDKLFKSEQKFKEAIEKHEQAVALGVKNEELKKEADEKHAKYLSLKADVEAAKEAFDLDFKAKLALADKTLKEADVAKKEADLLKESLEKKLAEVAAVQAELKEKMDKFKALAGV